MRNKRVLISGASVAGPASALWLVRYGFEVTVVELAPSLRGGGRAVDFRGETHLTVLQRMGILEELREIQTGGSPMTFVDERGKTLLHLPAEFAGGDVEVLRSDLARVLLKRSRGSAEYLFGDSITSMTETTGGVDVTFRSGTQRTFDLVIGADGLHSNVRSLAFGPEERYVSYLGYYAATWDLPNYLNLPPGSLNYNTPGKLASIGCDFRDRDQAGAFLVFKSERLDYDRHDLDQQKKILIDQYAGIGWETPRLLASLRDATELYFDEISRADVRPWSRGRISLVGDAACGATIGGMGTGTAVVAAYVLAGELAMAGGDHLTAYPRYERKLRGFAEGCQKSGDRTGKFLAPASRLGLRMRNGMLSNRLLLDMMIKAGKDVSTVDLADYPAAARV